MSPCSEGRWWQNRTYQAAHDDLAFAQTHRWACRNRLGSGFRISDSLFNATYRCSIVRCPCGSGIATSLGGATGCTPGAKDIIKRFVQFVRHGYVVVVMLQNKTNSLNTGKMRGAISSVSNAGTAGRAGSLLNDVLTWWRLLMEGARSRQRGKIKKGFDSR